MGHPFGDLLPLFGGKQTQQPQDQRPVNPNTLFGPPTTAGGNFVLPGMTAPPARRPTMLPAPSMPDYTAAEELLKAPVGMPAPQPFKDAPPARPAPVGPDLDVLLQRQQELNNKMSDPRTSSDERKQEQRTALLRGALAGAGSMVPEEGEFGTMLARTAAGALGEKDALAMRFKEEDQAFEQQKFALEAAMVQTRNQVDVAKAEMQNASSEIDYLNRADVWAQAQREHDMLQQHRMVVAGAQEQRRMQLVDYAMQKAQQQAQIADQQRGITAQNLDALEQYNYDSQLAARPQVSMLEDGTAMRQDYTDKGLEISRVPVSRQGQMALDVQGLETLPMGLRQGEMARIEGQNINRLTPPQQTDALINQVLETGVGDQIFESNVLGTGNGGLLDWANTSRYEKISKKALTEAKKRFPDDKAAQAMYQRSAMIAELRKTLTPAQLVEIQKLNDPIINQVLRNRVGADAGALQ